MSTEHLPPAPPAVVITVLIAVAFLVGVAIGHLIP